MAQSEFFLPRALRRKAGSVAPLLVLVAAASSATAAAAAATTVITAAAAPPAEQELLLTSSYLGVSQARALDPFCCPFCLLLHVTAACSSIRSYEGSAAQQEEWEATGGRWGCVQKASEAGIRAEEEPRLLLPAGEH